MPLCTSIHFSEYCGTKPSGTEQTPCAAVIDGDLLLHEEVTIVCDEVGNVVVVVDGVGVGGVGGVGGGRVGVGAAVDGVGGVVGNGTVAGTGAGVKFMGQSLEIVTGNAHSDELTSWQASRHQ